MAEHMVCAASALLDSGPGVRFEVNHFGEKSPAFAVRYEGRVHAYINRCPHVPTELDWEAGRFFDPSGLLLICSNHGAVFLPHDGKCIGGPCNGRSLYALTVEERDGKVFVKEAEHVGRQR